MNRAARFLTIGVITIGGLIAPASPVRAAPVQQPPGAVSQVMSHINAERSARGLPALAFDPGSSAQCAAEAFRASGNPHPPGCDGPGVEASVATLKGTGSAIRAFMGSEGHRRILMQSNATSARVGVACAADGTMFVVVQVDSPIGPDPAGDPAPSPVVSKDNTGFHCPTAPPTTQAPPPPTTQAPAPQPPTTQAPAPQPPKPSPPVTSPPATSVSKPPAAPAPGGGVPSGPSSPKAPKPTTPTTPTTGVAARPTTSTTVDRTTSTTITGNGSTGNDKPASRPNNSSRSDDTEIAATVDQGRHSGSSSGWLIAATALTAFAAVVVAVLYARYGRNS